MSKSNILDLLNSLESELKVDAIAEHILAIAVARNVLLKDLHELADREVSGTSLSKSSHICLIIPSYENVVDSLQHPLPRQLCAHKDHGTCDELFWTELLGIKRRTCDAASSAG